MHYTVNHMIFQHVVKNAHNLQHIKPLFWKTTEPNKSLLRYRSESLKSAGSKIEILSPLLGYIYVAVDGPVTIHNTFDLEPRSLGMKKN